MPDLYIDVHDEIGISEFSDYAELIDPFQLVGFATANGTTVTLPAHQEGDVFVGGAARLNNTEPGLPAGWVNLSSAGRNTQSLRVAWRTAVDSSTASGTWTNATRLAIVAYRPWKGWSISVGESAVVDAPHNTPQTYQRYPQLSQAIRHNILKKSLMFPVRANDDGQTIGPPGYANLLAMAANPALSVHQFLPLAVHGATHFQTDITGLTSSAYRTVGTILTLTPPETDSTSVILNTTNNHKFHTPRPSLEFTGTDSFEGKVRYGVAIWKKDTEDVRYFEDISSPGKANVYLIDGTTGEKRFDLRWLDTVSGRYLLDGPREAFYGIYHKQKLYATHSGAPNMQVVDLLSPVLARKTIYSGGGRNGFQKEGNHVYFASGGAVVKINTEDVEDIEVCSFAGTVTDFKIHNGYVYVANDTNVIKRAPIASFLTENVEDFCPIQQTGTMMGYSVALDDTYIYIGTRSASAHAPYIERRLLSDPYGAYSLSQVSLNIYARWAGLCVHGDFLYVVTSTGTLSTYGRILRSAFTTGGMAAPPSSPGLLTNQPYNIYPLGDNNKIVFSLKMSSTSGPNVVCDIENFSTEQPIVMPGNTTPIAIPEVRAYSSEPKYISSFENPADPSESVVFSSGEKVVFTQPEDMEPGEYEWTVLTSSSLGTWHPEPDLEREVRTFTIEASTFSVTIDHTKVAANLTDFPVYIDLSDMPQSFWDRVSEGGGDIRCYKEDGTEIPREVVSCDTTAKTGELHVKYTGTEALSSTSDTVIKVEVDGVGEDYAATDTYGRNAVWSDYSWVSHMEDLTTSTILDSTSGGRTGTKTSANNPEVSGGQIGNSQEISGDRIDTDSVPMTATDNFTIQAWLRPTEGTGNFSSIVYNGGDMDGDGAGIGISGDSWAFPRGGSKTWGQSDLSVTTDSWALIHCVRDSGTSKVFSNSIQASSVQLSAVAPDTPTTRLRLGVADLYGSYEGKIDEVRLRESALSADWITTEYSNQSSPSTFYSIAKQTSVSEEVSFDEQVAILKDEETSVFEEASFDEQVTISVDTQVSVFEGVSFDEQVTRSSGDEGDTSAFFLMM